MLLCDKLQITDLPGMTPGAPFEVEGPLKNIDTIGDLFNTVLKFLFPLAGLILFFSLIVGGFQLLTSFGDQKKVEGAKARLTNSAIGIGLLFTSYWLVKLAGFILRFPTF